VWAGALLEAGIHGAGQRKRDRIAPALFVLGFRNPARLPGPCPLVARTRTVGDFHATVLEFANAVGGRNARLASPNAWLVIDDAGMPCEVR
jgi:hypothetical protein